MKKRIKIVWICEFSNKEIREKLHFEKYSLFQLARKLLGKKQNVVDYGEWNTKAIKEFEKFNDIELHVISHHLYLRKKQENFMMNNIYYHFFKPEGNNLLSTIKRKFGLKVKTNNNLNSRWINQIIEKIQPDIVHLIGAENPHYSSSVLSLNDKYPLLVSLQTLMSDPNFYANYPITKDLYDYRCTIEKKVLQKADYICTIGKKFQEIILKDITPNAKFLKLKLAVGEDTTNITSSDKKYDFVYFAKDINKASDYAIEAFAIAQKKHKNITLNIVGGYSQEYKETLDNRIKELNIKDLITFSGQLPLHDDVLTQIQKSRFALLPLKIDIISGTIREAMAYGLPVITTITPGTPKLNDNRESVLLSPIGNHQAMADNMIKLLENKDLVHQLKNNANITIKERYNNHEAMNDWVKAYKAIYEHKLYKTTIPSDLFS